MDQELVFTYKKVALLLDDDHPLCVVCYSGHMLRSRFSLLMDVYEYY